MARKNNKEEAYKKSSSGPCNVSCLRFMLIACNFFFILGGAGAVVIGVWSLISKMQYVALLGSVYFNLIVYLLIVAGLLVLVTGVIGCVGAIRKNRSLLMAYFVLLIIIFAAEIIAGILGFVYHESIHDELVTGLRSNLNKNYNQTNQEALTRAVDQMQQDFKCCGVEMYSDWKNSTFIKQSQRRDEVSLKTPTSCCKSPSPRCSIRDHPSNIYRVLGNNDLGCLARLEKYLKDHLFILAITGVVVAILEIMVIVFSCFLRQAVKDEEEEEEPY